MKQYNVTGMSCAACSARVEKAVNKVPGVTSCSVSLLTNSMGVEGDATTADIIQAVEAAGYGASEKGASAASNRGGQKSGAQYAEEAKALEDHETPILLKRLISSLVFLCLLMYFSMGHSMWGWPLPPWFDGNYVAIGLTQMCLAVIVMVINQKFFVNGFKSLLHGAPNMDTLVALGSAASFGWSLYMLFLLTDAQRLGDTERAAELSGQFYFESAAMIVTLITVGKMLEAHSKGKTTDALKSLMQLAPKTATILRNDEEVTVAVEEVGVGDLFVVRPGESIPVDGIVIEGNSAVDESALTGESIPVDKAEGNSVSAATINKSGFIKCKATKVGADTSLAQIIKMVSDASATKAPIAKIADRVSGVFVPTVIGIALVTIIIWLILGQEVGFALARGISVLVISCPCALGLATPVAIMVGSGKGARNGILFKNAVSLENAGKTQIIALDKTGTITTGKPKVTDLIPEENLAEFLAELGIDIDEKIKSKVNSDQSDLLLYLAASAEFKSEHPLAHAVTEAADEKNMTPAEVTDFTALPGNGLKSFLQGKELLGGSLSFVSSELEKSDKNQNSLIKAKDKAKELAGQGKTPLLFALDGRLIGIVAVADTIKEEAVEAIRQIKNMGIHVVMLTGDNELTAKAIGDEAQVDQVIAGVLPEGKESAIRQLKKLGKVAMVGDGINDAPALTSADLGMAIGAGTDVAIDAADVVLMKSSLLDVPAAIRLSRRTLRNIKENLFWAFFYNIIGIPLAAGAYYFLLGWKLNPMFGAAAMSLSSFCVVSNALRLNLVKVYNDRKDHKIKKAIINSTINNEREELTMTKTMKIEGMMCGHCEARVKKTLEAIEGVTEAVVSHEAGTAVITFSQPVANDVLTKAVEDQDYKVLSVEE